MDIVVIPARSGSKRVKNKNFRPFHNSSLIEIAINFGKSLGMKTIVSTDNYSEIKKFQDDQVTVLQRTKKNSSDDATAEEVLREVISKCKLNDSDSIVYLQPTSPLRQISSIRNAIDFSKSHQDCVIMSVTATSDEFWMEDSENGFLRIGPILGEFYNSRNSKNRRPIYKENGNFYIIPVHLISELSNLSDTRVQKFVTSQEEDFDINTERDFFVCELLYASRLN